MTLGTDSKRTSRPLVGLSLRAYHWETGGLAATATTTSAGRYFLEVPRGRYRVVALGPGRFATQWAKGATSWDEAVPVSVHTTVVVLDFALSSGGAMTGQVTGPGRRPLRGQWVDIYDGVQGGLVAMAVASTDAAGRFARGLAPGIYKVQISGTGFAPQYFANAAVSSAVRCGPARPVTVTAGRTTPEVRVSLTRGRRLMGRVTQAATGDPVDEAVMVVNIPGLGTTITTRTNAEGRYAVSLAPGSYLLRARAPGTYLAPQYYQTVGDLEISDAATPVPMTSHTDTDEIDFVLAKGGIIQGQVRAATDGQPLAGVTLDAYDFRGIRFVDKTRTRFDGRYTLHLPPGDYKLRATAYGTDFARQYYGGIESARLSQTVGVAAGRRTSGIDFRLSTGGIIRGRVTFGGRGIPSVSVCFHPDGCVTSQFDGSYRMALTTGPYPYHVYPRPSPRAFEFAWDYQNRKVVELIPGRKEVVNFDLKRGEATLIGRITSQDGTPLPEVSVGVYTASSRSYVAGDATDSDGQYRLHLSAGDYRIRVWPRHQPFSHGWYQSPGHLVGWYDENWLEKASRVHIRREDTRRNWVLRVFNLTIPESAGSISGVLRSSVDGTPISAARVSIRGQTTGRVYQTSVRANGRYLAYGPPDD